MHTMFTDHYLAKAQNYMYAWENKYAKNHPIAGRIAAMPIAVADVALQTLKTPLIAIEWIVMAALNLIGALFSEKFSVKEALMCVEVAGTQILKLAIVLPSAPVKLIYQLFVSVINPAKAESIQYHPSMGDDKFPTVRYLFPQQAK